MGTIFRLQRVLQLPYVDQFHFGDRCSERASVTGIGPISLSLKYQQIPTETHAQNLVSGGTFDFEPSHQRNCNDRQGDYSTKKCAHFTTFFVLLPRVQHLSTSTNKTNQKFS